ncbi:MAG: hypothetical protein ACR2PF_10610 [Rhizobiaceae bacterium]
MKKGLLKQSKDIEPPFLMWTSSGDEEALRDLTRSLFKHSSMTSFLTLIAQERVPGTVLSKPSETQSAGGVFGGHPNALLEVFS